MIGALMLVALAACGIAVALWEKRYGPGSAEHVVRSYFVTTSTRVFFDGVQVEAVKSLTIAFREAGEAAEAFTDSLRANR